MPAHAGQQTTIKLDDLNTPENVTDLARVIATEARGVNETAQVMVGWTVVNRLKQSRLKRVSEVWGAYAHGHFETGTSRRIAENILNGTLHDISQAATYFYTPSAMPKQGDPLGRADVTGGLEAVPGVTKNGKPVQSYRPKWVDNYLPIRVPGVQDKDFKFFRSR